MSAVLALADVACLRGGRIVFEGVSLTLKAGEAALVTGPNGIGKSSLLRIAAGLLPPAAGRVERTGEIALLNEATALDGELPLARALGWWARIDGRKDAIAGALAAVQLSDAADVPVRWLSTGQRKRAGLARVVAGGAPMWLLDEPANGLDAASVDMLAGLVARHRAQGGIALIATHLPIEVPGARVLAL
ncbi:heme ABC exporter ATP-binding protein CcmA [Sphingomonas sp. RS2018]